MNLPICVCLIYPVAKHYLSRVNNAITVKLSTPSKNYSCDCNKIPKNSIALILKLELPATRIRSVFETLFEIIQQEPQSQLILKSFEFHFFA